MQDEGKRVSALQDCLDRLQVGDTRALDDLIEHASDRLQGLAHKMLRQFPGVQRWEETGDVLQNALMRLQRALATVKPQSPQQFLGLAAVQIRRELLDLARNLYGPEGLGANHATQPPNSSSKMPQLQEGVAAEENPADLLEWVEFHEQVNALPGDERELFDLLWYQGLSQVEAARILQVTERTVKRRWRSARVRLQQGLQDGSGQ